jgi:EAL domain-containing protein (putative c-di-GMP-specific phosphodiesterase class I)
MRCTVLVVGINIETQETIAILRKMGCDIVQGHFWSKELTQDEFIEFLEKPLSKLTT